MALGGGSKQKGFDSALRCSKLAGLEREECPVVPWRNLDDQSSAAQNLPRRRALD